MSVTVWTPTRKWLGNFIPGCFWLASVAAGLTIIVSTKQLIGPGLVMLVVANALSWVLLNFFGLYQNQAMKDELARILGADTDLPKDRVFVGFTSPKYSGLLDAHEDVGYLCFTKRSLIYCGENRSFDLEKMQITKISFRPNVHSLVGLGRWVCIDAVMNDKPVRMLVEPREKPTMLGNLRYGKTLLQKLQNWHRSH